MFRPGWKFDQQALIDFAKPLAEFWKLDGRDLVTSLRRLMAVRDTVLQRGSVESALERLLVVGDKMAATDDPGHKVLCSFLLGQTQSAPLRAYICPCR